MKSFLQNDNIEIYSTHNEERFFASERFIRTLKNKIYKYMNSLWKNVYIDKFDDINHIAKGYILNWSEQVLWFQC